MGLTIFQSWRLLVGVSESVDLEEVWSELQEGTWVSAGALRRIVGVDDETMGRVVNFLGRWKFIESRYHPELQVRRRRGAIDPMKTIELLRQLTNRTRRVAERVACRRCGGRQFNHLGRNTVECVRCHERQWYAIEATESLTSFIRSETSLASGHSTLG